MPEEEAEHAEILFREAIGNFGLPENIKNETSFFFFPLRLELFAIFASASPAISAVKSLSRFIPFSDYTFVGPGSGPRLIG